MMQHSFFLCKCLHPADVGAVSDRPRAWCSAQRIEICILAGGKYTLIHDNRPYEFYCRFCVFCNTPVTKIFDFWRRGCAYYNNPPATAMRCQPPLHKGAFAVISADPVRRSNASRVHTARLPAAGPELCWAACNCRCKPESTDGRCQRCRNRADL